VKRIILSTSVVVCMIGLGLALTNAWGQGAAKTAVESGPHKVGLIDMALLFSKYKKFEALRADLKAEIETADASMKARLEKIKGLQISMKELVPNSPDFVAHEKQITELAAAAEAERKNLQRKFMREETKVYQTVYREVLDAVNKYAAIYKYTLIIRYSRDEAEAGDDPQKVMQALQRQVVFNRAEDDITDSVLRYLNNQYKPTAGAAAPVRGAAKDPKTRGVTTN
jgi:Skp family chaperone for outer membrane proteins